MKTETLKQSDLLNRYLLGVASDQERTMVEEQYFDDDAGLDTLRRAEDELIDDYVRDALSTSDRALFENYFLCTTARRERLKAVKSFVDALTEPQAVDSFLFDEFLRWLDSNREKAAEKYETIRRGLIKLFTSRGFQNAEDLADETVERVVSRITEVKTSVSDPARYILGVARFVTAEQARRKAGSIVPDLQNKND